MSYIGKPSLLKTGSYGGKLYFDEPEFGNPPPSPPIRYLLQENGQFLLQENGFRIELELGTP